MRIELDGDLPEPVWPDGLTPRNAEPGEEERVYEAHMDAFADHWDFRRQPLEVWRSYSTNTHRYDPSLWWLVEDGDELAAISLNGWDFSGDPQFGWIQVLGVRPRWRKRGLGTALLLHSFRDFRDRGATRVGLGVDGESTTGAVRLYESVGMRQVRRNDTYEKSAVSRLRARCPDCRTFTAVAIGPGYECHSCGREYGAGLVRVPQAWGEGGESMAEAARLPLPFPGGGGGRGGDARRADAGGRDRPARAAARARRLLLRAHRRGRGARRPQRPDRAGLDRRARRPEHARELAVREPLGRRRSG